MLDDYGKKLLNVALGELNANIERACGKTIDEAV